MARMVDTVLHGGSVVLAPTLARRLPDEMSGLVPERIWQTPAVFSMVAVVA